MYSAEFDEEKRQEIEYVLMCKHKNIRRIVIGITECGREIVAYRVGNNGGVLMCAAFHGMERITSGMLYKFLDEVCTKREFDVVFSSMLEKSGLTVVPAVNPDGIEISINGVHSAGKLSEYVQKSLTDTKTHYSRWQANAMGVDINHNFNAGYEQVKIMERKMGINKPSPTRYGGKYAESEKETQAICNLCRRNKYKTAVALHTQGREIYYDFSKNTPKISLSMANEMSKISGYAVSHPQGIAVGGGFKDWFIQCFSRPAFTLEIGLGVNPLPMSAFVSEYKIVRRILWYLLNNSCT